MKYLKGDLVRTASEEHAGVCEVELSYRAAGGQTFLVVIRPDGHRQIWAEHEVQPHHPEEAEDPVRRKAVDLILDFRGVPRDYLFEYPYNEYESRERIKDAENLLDELTKVLDGR